MTQQQEETKAKMRAELAKLSIEEKQLFAAVYRIEQNHLHTKNAVPLADLLKKVKEIIR